MFTRFYLFVTDKYVARTIAIVLLILIGILIAVNAGLFVSVTLPRLREWFGPAITPTPSVPGYF
jgi:hypothetical protein